jgi:glycerophosphoryl diester phosphodiesterase
MKKFFTLAVTALLIVLSLVLYVNKSFTGLKVVPFYDGCKKVWGHRGYFKDHDSNSLPGIRQAFDLGAEGVELDVHFDLESNRFIVSHNYPYKLKDGRLLLLEDVFRESGKRGYFWLDFKNLRRLKRKDAKRAAKNLVSLLESYNLKSKAIVESKSALNLSIFSKAGLYTSYWISAGRGGNGFLARIKVAGYKARFLHGKFSAVSLDYRDFTPYVQDSFSGVPVHLFTLNTKSDVMKYLLQKNVKIILSDENYYLLGACEE